LARPVITPPLSAPSAVRTAPSQLVASALLCCCSAARHWGAVLCFADCSVQVVAPLSVPSTRAPRGRSLPAAVVATSLACRCGSSASTPTRAAPSFRVLPVRSKHARAFLERSCSSRILLGYCGPAFGPQIASFGPI